MKLTILGNNGPFPAAGGACSGYLVRNGEANILIDCGNGVLANLQRFIRIEELDAVVLTHLHSDHISDMLVLRYAIQVKNGRGAGIAPLPVYAAPEPAEEYHRLDIPGTYQLHPIVPGDTVTVGGMRIRFARLKHPVPDYGVSVEDGEKRFAFTGDTSLEESVGIFLRGADLALMDAGLLAKDKRDENAPHMTAGECGAMASKAGVKRLLLTHFWPEYELADLLAEAAQHFPGTEAASLMETYEI